MYENDEYSETQLKGQDDEVELLDLVDDNCDDQFESEQTEEVCSDVEEESRESIEDEDYSDDQEEPDQQEESEEQHSDVDVDGC